MSSFFFTIGPIIFSRSNHCRWQNNCSNHNIRPTVCCLVSYLPCCGVSSCILMPWDKKSLLGERARVRSCQNQCQHEQNSLVLSRVHRSEDFLNTRRDINSALGAYQSRHNNVDYDPDHVVRKQQRHNMRAVSEADLLSMEQHNHRPPSRQHRGGRRSQSRSRLDDDDEVFDDHPAELLANGAFVNHGMDNMEHHVRAGRLGGGGKAASQLSVASRAYLQNGGVSYRNEAPMLNDKYFPRDVYGGSNAYLGQTNVSIVPNGGVVTNGQGEYDGFKYPHLQLRNLSYDERRKGSKFERILDGITMEARGGELVAVMATKRE
jgi:hypothetical protein